MSDDTSTRIIELNGNMGVNGGLYREIYRRALVLIKAPNRSFSGGSVGRIVYNVLIEQHPDGYLRVDYTPPQEYPIPRLVVSVDRWGRIHERMLADVRTLKEVLDVLKRNMVLDDLANV